MDDTMIVVTSDHGDYLGDHWLGEKDLFHEPSVKVPLIVYDPREAADATRGTICDALVEIHRSRRDLHRGSRRRRAATTSSRDARCCPSCKARQPQDWRDFAVSEYDYSATPMARGARRFADATRGCS